MKRWHAVMALLWCALFCVSAEASIMYGASFDRDAIYSLNQTTGAATSVGSIAPMTDVRDLGSDTRPASARIWGTSQSTGELFRMDPATGRGTLVGSYGLPSPQNVGMRTLAFDVVGGKLYGTTNLGGSPADSKLYEINTSTGAATLIGVVGIEGLGGMGADWLGNLYAIREVSAEIFLIDKLTATPTLVSTLGVTVISDLAFRPEDNQLFGITHSGPVDQRQSVYQIDLATGTATRLGPYGQNVSTMAGLAFGAAVPEPGVIALLSTWMTVLVRRRKR